MTALPQRWAALLTLAGLFLAGCGSSSGPTAIGTSTTPVAKREVQRVTHANAVTLLPTASQVTRLIKPLVGPSRHNETLSSATLSFGFASRVPEALQRASGTAELDVSGAHGSSLYAHVYVFKNLAGAESLTSAFLASTRLGSTLAAPSDAPGQPRMASRQPYNNRRYMSYRYAFRDGNVLAYVELDGPRHSSSVAQAVTVARILDQHIRAAAGG